MCQYHPGGKPVALVEEEYLSGALVLSDRITISNWGIGGFAMGIIRGQLTYQGPTLPLYGFGELLI